jgi:hypothetical protein
MLDKTQIIVRTTHDCGPSLARAIDRSCQTARVFISFGASMPIRSDATLHHVLLERPQRRAIVRGAAPLYPNPVTVNAWQAEHDRGPR